MDKRIIYRVTEEDLPADVRTILRKRLGLSEHQIKSAKFRPDGICRNGVRVRITEKVIGGDCLEVLLEREEEVSAGVKGERGPLDILYEDEDMILVNKAPGVPVHPGHGHYCDTLANHLMYYFQEQGINATIRAVGRLDRETSGIVVFAKNRVAAARLTGKSVEKEYLALVRGQLREKKGCIEWSIRKKAGELNQMEISPNGANARTYYQVLQEYPEASLVSLHLDTGRTHQIRVHMAAMGHPLLGDRIYGTMYPENQEGKVNGPEMSGREMERAALHCRRVKILHPFTGEKIAAEVPLPEDMKGFLEKTAGPDGGKFEKGGDLRYAQGKI